MNSQLEFRAAVSVIRRPQDYVNRIPYELWLAHDGSVISKERCALSSRVVQVQIQSPLKFLTSK